MEPENTMEGSTFFAEPGSRKGKNPQDGIRKYFIEIWQPGLLLTITTCFTVIFYSVYRDPYTSRNLEYQFHGNDLFFCNADGNVEKSEPRYNPFWDPRLYFTINLAFGQFTFSTVKVLDASWDVIVGRGGQMLTAIIAYRILRRSFTLTMETLAVTIPTVAALYCHQVQLVSLFKLTSEIFWHWSPKSSKRKRMLYTGKLRLGIQAFVCVYVLLFATIVSVMTGYRAQLTGYFDEGGQGRNSGLVPVSQLARPAMVISDASRIGLSDSPLYIREEVPLRQLDLGSFYLYVHLQDSNFTEPYGTLVDCKCCSPSVKSLRNKVLKLSIDYWTCLGLARWVSQTRSRHITSRTLRCAKHDCSCTARDVDSPEEDPHEDINSTRAVIYDSLASHLTMDAKRWDLDASPLTIGVSSKLDFVSIRNETSYKDVSDFWYYAWGTFLQEEFVYHNYTPQKNSIYLFNNTYLEEDTIKRAGRCVSEDQYQWGFSSLLLLTFCIFTNLFAFALIVLQTDVYWNSRHDRSSQSHSLYADILYLAGELKTRFPGKTGENMPSPEVFGEEVERSGEKLCVGAINLPLSRWQERRTIRAANAALRDRLIPRWRPQGTRIVDVPLRESESGRLSAS
jgi:hypothetical protein